MHLPQRVGHAGLVSQEGSEVDWLAGVIFGPGTHPAPVFLATLVGQEPHVSMTGCMEFAMRLEKDVSQTKSLVNNMKLMEMQARCSTMFFLLKLCHKNCIYRFKGT